MWLGLWTTLNFFCWWWWKRLLFLAEKLSFCFIRRKMRKEEQEHHKISVKVIKLLGQKFKLPRQWVGESGFMNGGHRLINSYNRQLTTNACTYIKKLYKNGHQLSISIAFNFFPEIYSRVFFSGSAMWKIFARIWLLKKPSVNLFAGIMIQK